MADPLTGAAVSGVVKLLFDKLGSPFFKEIERSFGVKSQLQRMRRTLSAIGTVLVDAEEQQTTQHSVREWLLNLKDVAFDIEDVLDLLSTQALEDRVRQTTFVPKLRKFVPQCGLARKLKDICDRLEEISANRRDFHFQERPLSVPPSVCINWERDQSSDPDPKVFGRKEEQDLIVSRLVSSFSGHEISEIPVLPIVGLGGMGKTTLARLVFNDDRVKGNFSLKLWVSMPNEFSMKTAIEKICKFASGKKSSDSESRLRGILSGQPFLLVVDNVWFENSKEWVDFKNFLEVGSKSSIIIVTTREDRVAKKATMEPHKLQRLSEDDCWTVFVKYAFKKGEEKDWPTLVRIGKEIARKCCGVPLAARTLGSQLGNNREEAEWRKIEESKLWNIKQDPDDILPALKLSFDQLPYYLKPCFSFCSSVIDPRLSRSDMEDYWMALGLTESRDMNGNIEERGTTYFNELVSKSFFQVLPAAQYFQAPLKDATDPAKLLQILEKMYPSTYFEAVDEFQMHDLVRELGRYVAGEEIAYVSFDTPQVSARVRYLVWTEENCIEREFPTQLLIANKARSFQSFKKGWDFNERGHMSTSFLQSLISNFRCLRILSLVGFEFDELPNSIGDSKHLRYLELNSNEKLKRLPDSISKLVNLQTFNVLGCTQLEVFPRKLHRWINLRNLYITSKLDSCLETFYHGWTSIRKITIWCAHLTSLSDEFGTLANLRELEIYRCPNLVSLPNTMHLLISLERLRIRDCEKLKLSGWEGLNGLGNLQVLYIYCLPLLEHFPDGLQHCTSLLRLIVRHCKNLSTLPRGIETVKSLQFLWILGSPILRSRLEREQEYSELISHIPTIHIWS